MPTMNISIPEPLRQWVEQQVAEGGYSSVSEYMRELVRLDKRSKARERLELLIQEGLDSGDPIEADEAFWAAKHAEVDRLMANRKQAE